MRFARCVLTAATFVAAALLAVGCAGGGASGSAPGSSAAASGDSSGGTWNEGDPVRGNVSVTWKNLDPKYPANTISVVNASSEIGQKLTAGRATSSEIRVATDAQMGALLTELKRLGFFRYATPGISLENLPDAQGPKGVIVVTQDGRSQGLFMQLGLGRSPVPEAYTNCKRLVVAAHSQLQGFDARASLGAPDENVFSAPKPTFRRP